MSEQTIDYQKPLPVPSVETQSFWEGCKRHELLLPRCNQCGHHWFPPAYLCPECLGADWAWTPASGRGRVYTFGVYHRVYHKAFQDDIPYTVAVVELEEGPRLTSNIANCPPSDVRCDMPVHVRFDDVTSEVTLYKFAPA